MIEEKVINADGDTVITAKAKKPKSDSKKAKFSNPLDPNDTLS